MVTGQGVALDALSLGRSPCTQWLLDWVCHIGNVDAQEARKSQPLERIATTAGGYFILFYFAISGHTLKNPQYVWNAAIATESVWRTVASVPKCCNCMTQLPISCYRMLCQTFTWCVMRFSILMRKNTCCANGLYISCMFYITFLRNLLIVKRHLRVVQMFCHLTSSHSRLACSVDCNIGEIVLWLCPYRLTNQDKRQADRNDEHFAFEILSPKTKEVLPWQQRENILLDTS